MYTHELSLQVIKQNTIQIMKSKGEFDEKKTTIKTSKLNLGQVEFYLIEVNQISSTMILSQNWPKEFLKATSKPAIFAFRADRQTSGRGQRENQWSSPEGNLYLTVLIQIEFAYFPYLPIIAISNVFRTIQTYLTESKAKNITKIKWINDILIDFEKVSGVLIKNEMIGQCLFTEIGIGVNIKQSPTFASEKSSMSQSTTYLQKHTQSAISLQDFTLRLIQTFVDAFFLNPIEKVKNQAKNLYQSNLAYLKKQVLIYDYKYEQIMGSGVFQGINQYGHALIEGSEKPFVEGRMKVHQAIW